MKRLILMVGHSKTSEGTHVEINGVSYKERFIVLDAITGFLKDYHNEELEVIVKTRTDKSGRNIAKELNALSNDGVPTYVISCHLNGVSNKDVQGEEILVGSNTGVSIAKKVRKVTEGIFNIRWRGIKKVTRADRGSFIILDPKPVVLLLEPFFLTGIKTEEEMVDVTIKYSRYLKEIANVIVKL